ncbi:hypothetical protein ACRWQL_19600 [Shewanella sp. HL-SH4]|uniref:hypothetical protein n=1 Tax=Shewanella sp. HL-SH4 TaxID=3436240 RepID=UPI003EB7ADC8
MLKIFKILVLAIVICKPVFADFEYNPTDYLGEASVEVMKTVPLLTINNFSRKNKTMDLLHINDICRMTTQDSMTGKEASVIDTILRRENIDKKHFQEVGFVNVDCASNNFIVDAMIKSIPTLDKLIEYGFNFNRPLQYQGKVGTVLDVAALMMEKYKAEGNDEQFRQWRMRYGKFKRKKYLTCKEQGIKCSIDIGR